MSNEPRTHDLNTIVDVANRALSGDADHAVERFEAGSFGTREALKIYLKNQVEVDKLHTFSSTNKLTFFSLGGDRSIIYLLKSQIDAAGPAALMSALERMDRSSLGLPPAPAEADPYDALMLARAANAIIDLDEDDKEPLFVIPKISATRRPHRIITQPVQIEPEKVVQWLKFKTGNTFHEQNGFYVTTLPKGENSQQAFETLLNERLADFTFREEQPLKGTMNGRDWSIPVADINMLAKDLMGGFTARVQSQPSHTQR